VPASASRALSTRYRGEGGLALVAAGVEHMDTHIWAATGNLPPILVIGTRTMVVAIFPVTDSRMSTPDIHSYP
jgi:hypothetical protein